MEDRVFEAPTKRIVSDNDLHTFQKSPAIQRISTVIKTLSDAAVGKKCSSAIPKLSGQVQLILDLLSRLDLWISEIPPKEGPRRFGNVAFRQWIQRLEENAYESLLTIIPKDGQPAITELSAYLTGAFGSGQRLDYGTGHELSFVAFIGGLLQIGALEHPADSLCIVLCIFKQYFKVVRKLVSIYNLEPAGSHGVWGLDDHSFLPYLFGSAQLIMNAEAPSPDKITNERVVNDLAEEYLYFGAVRFINEVKKGPFFEHSPILYDISAVPNWKKINGVSSV